MSECIYRALRRLYLTKLNEIVCESELTIIFSFYLPFAYVCRDAEILFAVHFFWKQATKINEVVAIVTVIDRDKHPNNEIELKIVSGDAVSGKLILYLFVFI